MNLGRCPRLVWEGPLARENKTGNRGNVPNHFPPGSGSLHILRPDAAWFWQTQGGAELDLLALTGRQRLGFEMQLAESPRTTKSMRTAIHDLRLDHLYVIHPGELRFALDDGITALPAREIPTLAAATF